MNLLGEEVRAYPWSHRDRFETEACPCVQTGRESVGASFVALLEHVPRIHRRRDQGEFPGMVLGYPKDECSFRASPVGQATFYFHKCVEIRFSDC